MKTSPNKIFVDFEYGDLKEVILGIPFCLYADLSTAKWEATKILPEAPTKRQEFNS